MQALVIIKILISIHRWLRTHRVHALFLWLSVQDAWKLKWHGMHKRFAQIHHTKNECMFIVFAEHQHIHSSMFGEELLGERVLKTNNIANLLFSQYIGDQSHQPHYSECTVCRVQEALHMYNKGKAVYCI